MPNEQKLHVVLYQPEIAANAGAIGRTCVAAGATLWLVRPPGSSTSTTGDRARAALDQPWTTWNSKIVDEAWTRSSGPPALQRLWSFSTRAARVYTDATYEPGDALIFGPESRGLPASWLDERPDRAVRIPIRPEARSLNLANAVAIGVFEAVRQIGGPDPGPKARLAE